MKLSLVIPCYNEEKNIEPMFNAVTSVFDGAGYSYEMIFVNDGSSDKTHSELLKLYKSNYRGNMKVITFSRNFGKEAAIYAGLKASSGDYVTLIDSDLQQRPETAAEMVKVLDENSEYDCVAAFQESRHESKALVFFKKSFYRLINKMSDTEFVNGASDFRTLRRKMVEAVLEMSEYHRFSKGIFSWVGFNTKYTPYTADERANGTTKWSFFKLLKYAIDGIVAFTTFPLKLAAILGFTSAVVAVIYAIVVIIQKLCFSIAVPGYATIVVLILLIGGLQLFGMGILGEYLSKIYLQVKNRPVYIVKEVLGDDKTKETPAH